MRIRFALALTLFLGLSACASGPQVRQVLKNPPPIPSLYQIEGVPFIQQEIAQCGPASLAMVLKSHGRAIDVGDVTPLVYTPGKKGSLQNDLVSAARRLGFLAIPIAGFESLLKELAVGHPVIIFENQGLSVWPRYHYAVATGYDLLNQEITFHTGPKANYRDPMNYFERRWRLVDYWGVVVLPPELLSASGDELAHAQGALGLENVGNLEAAEKVYRQMLRRWPQSLSALIAMGNLTYQRKDYKGAVGFLESAVKFHPESQSAKNNLAVAKAALGSR